MVDKVLNPSAIPREFYPDSIGRERPMMPPLIEDPGTVNVVTTTVVSDHLGYRDTHGLIPLAKRNMNLGEDDPAGLN
jgi:hypothetical protein